MIFGRSHYTRHVMICYREVTKGMYGDLGKVMEGYNQWPQNPPKFRDLMEEYIMCNLMQLDLMYASNALRNLADIVVQVLGSVNITLVDKGITLYVAEGLIIEHPLIFPYVKEVNQRVNAR
ncbi:hypothetical protein P8452_71107 [Trifolium repens]|nr:hypothetical protein P8452_71107 [Trifolium repens]